MSASDDGAEKPHDPTPKKLEDARRKGEIARSADLNTAAGYAGLALVAAGFGAIGLGGLAETGVTLLGQADRIAPLVLGDGGRALAGGLMGRVLLETLPWFAGPALAALASILAQRSLVFAPSRLEPKLSRLSPIANARNKFGPSGLFEFAKSATKLTVYSVFLAIFLWRGLPEIVASLGASPGMAVTFMGRLCLEFLIVLALIGVLIGAVDYLWQVFEHLRRNRMTLQELKDEVKQAEGDPHMKQQRRQRGTAIALNRMLADVPSADVVIVNPTHYAVALRWDKTRAGAPLCVAKGVDEIAARIRERAIEAGVPLHRDPPTARALHATVEIGQEIRREQYRAVAVAIRFAERMRSKARRRR